MHGFFSNAVRISFLFMITEWNLVELNDLRTIMMLFGGKSDKGNYQANITIIAQCHSHINLIAMLWKSHQQLQWIQNSNTPSPRLTALARKVPFDAVPKNYRQTQHQYFMVRPSFPFAIYFRNDLSRRKFESLSMTAPYINIMCLQFIPIDDEMLCCGHPFLIMKNSLEGSFQCTRCWNAS